MKRFFAGSLGIVAIIAGIFFAFTYAQMALEDFNNPQVSLWSALAANVISWGISATAIILGLRFLKRAATARQK